MSLKAPGTQEQHQELPDEPAAPANGQQRAAASGLDIQGLLYQKGLQSSCLPALCFEPGEKSLQVTRNKTGSGLQQHCTVLQAQSEPSRDPLPLQPGTLGGSGGSQQLDLDMGGLLAQNQPAGPS